MKNMLKMWRELDTFCKCYLVACAVFALAFYGAALYVAIQY